MQGKVLQTDKNAHRIVAFPAFDAGGNCRGPLMPDNKGLSCIMLFIDNFYQF